MLKGQFWECGAFDITTNPGFSVLFFILKTSVVVIIAQVPSQLDSPRDNPTGGLGVKH